ncbi:aromatic-ring hydroxylase C-terminal domain-containing protein [Amycolatopsis alkalitolerans]
MSTLDLVGKGGFTVVTGLAGGQWQTAAARAGIRCVRIGADGARDAYGDWGRVPGLDEEGCLLVRPDGYIAWRGPALTEGHANALAQALSQILQR